MTSATTPASVPEAGASGAGPTGRSGIAECWCCGQQRSDDQVVYLGNHPEVSVCLRYAHFLHNQAGQREDALHPSIASLLRDGLRRGRRLVIDRGWQQHPVIGRPLRWLGRYLP